MLIDTERMGYLTRPRGRQRLAPLLIGLPGPNEHLLDNVFGHIAGVSGALRYSATW
jgi:hypothetical protein